MIKLPRQFGSSDGLVGVEASEHHVQFGKQYGRHG
jgi:hypothetical protein